MQSPEILAIRFNELIQFEVAWRHDSLALRVLFFFFLIYFENFSYLYWCNF